MQRDKLEKDRVGLNWAGSGKLDFRSVGSSRGQAQANSYESQGQVSPEGRISFTFHTRRISTNITA